MYYKHFYYSFFNIVW